jgi:hypothetical protein
LVRPAKVAADLDSGIRISLQSLVNDLRSYQYPVREREIVSLFVLGHLVPRCKELGVLADATQVAIDGAVPQVITGERSKPQVCKDVVIWPKPRMTCWDDQWCPVHYPVAVLEWKNILRRDNGRTIKRKLVRTLSGLRQCRQRRMNSWATPYS